MHQRFGHIVERTAENFLEFIEGQVNPMVGKTALREVIGSYSLGAIATTDQGFSFGRLLLLLFLFFCVVYFSLK